MIFGAGLTSAAPGSADGLQLVVTDIEAARAELASRGRRSARSSTMPAGSSTTPATPHGSPGRHRTARATARCLVQRPGRQRLVLQEVTTRLPGRVSPAPTPYSSVAELAGALRRAAAAHGKHEAETGQADPDWPDWYAEYMVDERSTQSTDG